MGRDTEKAKFSLLFEAVKGFVNVRIHEPFNGIAGMNMGQIKIVGADSLQTGFNRSHDIFDRGRIAQMALCRAELGNDKELIALIALNALAQGFFRPGPRIIRGRIKIIDAPINGPSHDIRVVEPGTTERDIRHFHARPAQWPIAAHPGFLPVRAFFLRFGFRLAQQKQLGLILTAGSQRRRATDRTQRSISQKRAPTWVGRLGRLGRLSLLGRLGRLLGHGG